MQNFGKAGKKFFFGDPFHLLLIYFSLLKSPLRAIQDLLTLLGNVLQKLVSTAVIAFPTIEKQFDQTQKPEKNQNSNTVRRIIKNNKKVPNKIIDEITKIKIKIKKQQREKEQEGMEDDRSRVEQSRVEQSRAHVR